MSEEICQLNIGPLPPSRPGTTWREARLWFEVVDGTTPEELEERFKDLIELTKIAHKELTTNSTKDDAEKAVDTIMIRALQVYATFHKSLAIAIKAVPGSENDVERERAAYIRALETRAEKLKFQQ